MTIHITHTQKKNKKKKKIGINMWTLVYLLLLPLFLFFFLNQYSKFGFRKLPPGPTTFQLFQNLSSLSKKPHVALNHLAKTYGPLMSFRLGGRLIVVASSQATAMSIFKTHNRIFSGRHLPSVYYDIPGVAHASLVMASECNDTWRCLRGLGQNFIFSSKAIESAAGIRRAKVDEMVGFLRRIDEAVCVEDVVSVTFTNIISRILTSTDLFDGGGGSERDERVKGFLGSVVDKVTSVGLTDVFPVLRGLDFWNKGRAMDIYGEMLLIWDDVIMDRKIRSHDRDHANSNSNSMASDFLDVLNDHGFPDGHISILLTELLIAARDSTHITVVWLMVELIKNQETLHRVRAEIANKAIEDDGTLNESLLSECRYLQACIKETLRLHIPGPLSLPRRALETCSVNNFTIPKDSLVLVNAWAIQTDPDNWEDASSFKPDRFLDSRVDFKGSHFGFIPFGAGQRMCPGSNVAVKGVQLVAAALVHYFDWSVPNGEDPAELDTADRFGTTLKKDKPLYLIPRGRGL